MDDVQRLTGLLTLAIIGFMAFFIVAAVLVDWILWELRQVLLRGGERTRAD